MNCLKLDYNVLCDDMVHSGEGFRMLLEGNTKWLI